MFALCLAASRARTSLAQLLWMFLPTVAPCQCPRLGTDPVCLVSGFGGWSPTTRFLSQEGLPVHVCTSLDSCEHAAFTCSVSHHSRFCMAPASAFLDCPHAFETKRKPTMFGVPLFEHMPNMEPSFEWFETEPKRKPAILGERKQASLGVHYLFLGPSHISQRHGASHPSALRLG